MTSQTKIQTAINQANNFISSVKNLETNLPKLKEQITPADYTSVINILDPTAVLSLGAKEIVNKDVDSALSFIHKYDGVGPSYISILNTYNAKLTTLGKSWSICQIFQTNPNHVYYCSNN